MVAKQHVSAECMLDRLTGSPPIQGYQTDNRLVNSILGIGLVSCIFVQNVSCMTLPVDMCTWIFKKDSMSFMNLSLVSNYLSRKWMGSLLHWPCQDCLLLKPIQCLTNIIIIISIIIAMFWSMHFTYINSCSCCNCLWNWPYCYVFILLISKQRYREVKWLHYITQLVGSRAKIETQLVYIWSLCSYPKDTLNCDNFTETNLL